MVCFTLYLVLERQSPRGIQREPPNITVIERSANTTVYQGPTQLYVAPEDDSTNPVVILKGKFYFLRCANGLTKRRTCIKPVFDPPRKPKFKSYFTTFSLGSLIK